MPAILPCAARTADTAHPAERFAGWAVPVVPHRRSRGNAAPVALDRRPMLCDVDHGLVHDLDLVVTRRNGRLVVVAPDGRRVWGAADAAFTAGIAAVTGDVAVPAGFAGVEPIDARLPHRPTAERSGPEAGPGLRSPPAAVEERTVAGEGRKDDPLVAVLFPDGPPLLPDAMHVNGERMDMAYVVGVLMGNRDLRRRLEAEARGEVLVAA